MKKRICVAALVASVALTGCASVPSLSEKNNDMVSQYIAGAVLKHTSDYKYSFEYDKTVLKPTPIPTPTPSPVSTVSPNTGNTGSSSGNNAAGGSDVSSGSSEVSSVKKVNLDEIYNISGVSVKPVHYETKKSITTAYSSVSANDGKKLVIVSFKIKNNSSAAKKVNLAKKNINYSISIGGNSYGSPLLSIVEGDMLSFTEKLAAGTGKTGVLIFQVDSSVKVKDVVVKAVKGNKESEVTVKSNR